ncbi:hypothetical protein IFM89_003254 [Coptis chinensis]|uniref:Phytocyanin domain-containing protein n=1 Tax=Coptis chinensis TaxID=261450 RepID=A0A835M1A8_9MAGN|nr:hypothetical protein IFM89_003254 [Coptis chinensis]
MRLGGPLALIIKLGPRARSLLLGTSLYSYGVHNVFKVNETSFKDCTVPPESEALTSGNDVITLATPGRKWYICGVGKHCQIGGQKLFIIVQDTTAPIASPTAAPASTSTNLLMI